MRGLLDSGCACTLVNSWGAGQLLEAGLQFQGSRFSKIRVANAVETTVDGEFSVPFRVRLDDDCEEIHMV